MNAGRFFATRRFLATASLAYVWINGWDAAGVTLFEQPVFAQGKSKAPAAGEGPTVVVGREGEYNTLSVRRADVPAEIYRTLRLIEDVRVITTPAVTVDFEGRTVVLVLWRERLLEEERPADGQGVVGVVDGVGGVVPCQAISYDDGDNFIFAGETNYRIGTGSNTYTPVGNDGFGERQSYDLIPELAADDAPGGARLHVVQFVTQALHEYAAGVIHAGGAIRKYYPYNAWIVECDDEALQRIASLPYVRWTGPYHPQLRLMPEMAHTYFESDRDPSSYEPARCNVMLFSPSPERNSVVMGRIEALGGRIEAPELRGSLIVATLSVPQLLAVIRMDEVMYVDRWAPVDTDMANVRAVGGATALAVPANGGFTGTGVRGEVMDVRFHPTHNAWRVGGVPIAVRHGTEEESTGIVASRQHGTATFGIVFGSDSARVSSNDPTQTFMGMLPGSGRLGDTEGAAIFSSLYRLTDYTEYQGVPVATLSRFAHTAELVGYGTTTNYRAVFQSNSWGTSQTVIPAYNYTYSTRTANLDDIIWKMDLVICQSQGNTGVRNSRTEAMAKNVVSVGGVGHKDNTNNSDDIAAGSPLNYQTDCLASQYPDCPGSATCNFPVGASIGPAPDMRIKPDLCHYYENIETSAIVSTATPDDDYTCYFNGTSAATPIVAGHFGLFFQLWNMENFPARGDSTKTVFNSRCHSSTARAALINSAYRYSIQGSSHFTRDNEGWGRPDAFTEMREQRCHYFIVDEELNLTAVGQHGLYTLSVDGSLPLKVTMVFSDPAGVPYSDPPPAGKFTAPNRINNLELIVHHPDGVTKYRGNYGLDSNDWSVAGGQGDPLNTVENVFIQSPTPGVWTIEVLLKELNQDGDPETPGTTDIDFGLVVFGVESYCASGVRGDWNRDGKVSPDDLHAFLTDFLAGSADYNHDSKTDATDFREFFIDLTTYL